MFAIGPFNILTEKYNTNVVSTACPWARAHGHTARECLLRRQNRAPRGPGARVSRMVGVCYQNVSPDTCPFCTGGHTPSRAIGPHRFMNPCYRPGSAVGRDPKNRFGKSYSSEMSWVIRSSRGNKSSTFACGPRNCLRRAPFATNMDVFARNLMFMRERLATCDTLMCVPQPKLSLDRVALLLAVVRTAREAASRNRRQV